jgi:hypothetical protein
MLRTLPDDLKSDSFECSDGLLMIDAGEFRHRYGVTSTS